MLVTTKLLVSPLTNISLGNAHVHNVTRLIAQKVYQLAKIKHFIDQDTRKTYYISQIQSHFDSCPTVLDGCPVSNTKRLYSLQKRAVKLISDKHQTETTDQHKHLRILPLKNRFLFNKAKFTHRNLSQNAPTYLLE